GCLPRGRPRRAHDARRRSLTRGRRAARGRKGRDRALLAGGAALVAGALEHLAVLLLAHALAALLDERSHGGAHPSGRLAPTQSRRVRGGEHRRRRAAGPVRSRPTPWRVVQLAERRIL